jgi:uncharacterized membrane protein HdeD (DUF308 family)
VFPILLILFGLFAIRLPFETSLRVVRVTGWLLILSGVTQIVYGFRTRGLGNIFWKFFVAMLHGVYRNLPPHSHHDGGRRPDSPHRHLLAHSGRDGRGPVSHSAKCEGGSTWILSEGIVALILGVMV